ncbi:hypothetical protein FRC04_004988 [Tulasnella sp. 424]|nr:hypothetical protein FRC04_004988 [Tulasnella sp. 424]
MAVNFTGALMVILETKPLQQSIATSSKTIDNFKGTNPSPGAVRRPLHARLLLCHGLDIKARQGQLVLRHPFFAVNSDGNADLVVQDAKQILGKTLLGLQLANEPDL